MELIETNKGVIAMTEYIDYAMWKSRMAWELAMRIIPEKPEPSGRWITGSYLERTQEELEKAYDVVNSVFTLKKLNG